MIALPIPSMNAALDKIFGTEARLMERGLEYEGSVSSGKQKTLLDEYNKHPSQPEEYTLDRKKRSDKEIREGRECKELQELVQNGELGKLSEEASPYGQVVKKDSEGEAEKQVISSVDWSGPEALRQFRSRLGEPSRNNLFSVVMTDVSNIDGYALESDVEAGQESTVSILNHTADVLKRCVSAKIPSWRVTERSVRVGVVRKRIPDILEVQDSLSLRLTEGIDQKTKMWVYRWLNTIFTYRGLLQPQLLKTMAVLDLHPTTRDPVGGVLLYDCFPVSCSISEKNMESGSLQDVTIEIACSDMMFGDIDELYRLQGLGIKLPSSCHSKKKG